MPLEGASNSERTLALLALVLAAVMFVFPLTVYFPLLDPDEGLHASIAQAMVETGDWTTPTFLGEPFLDKPILYFWVQAASLSWFGPCEAAVRLPGLMFGLLGAITTGLLGNRLFNRMTGWMAGILYATTILPTALAQAASHDVALVPWVNLTLLLLWDEPPGDESPSKTSAKTRFLAPLLAGVFLGLAILTKGLFGVAVVATAYGGYMLIGRRWSLAMVLRGATALAVGVLVASPWYIAVDRQQPGYLYYYFIDRHLLGLTTESQPHGDQPWWYYLPVLFGGGLPWIGYLPVVVRDGWAKRSALAGLNTGVSNVSPSRRKAMLLLWCWLIGWTLLMQAAGSKLATYLWPVFPPLAILIATAWVALVDGTLCAAARRSFARTFVPSSWGGVVVLPAAVLGVQLVYDVRFSWPIWTTAMLVALTSPLPLLAWRAGRWLSSLAAAVLCVAAQFVVVIALVFPTVAETCSARELAEHFNQQGRLPSRLFVVEGRIGSLVFYLDRSLRDAIEPDQFQQVLAKELPPLHSGDVIAVNEWKVYKLRRYFPADNEPYESVGSYRLYGSGSERPQRSSQRSNQPGKRPTLSKSMAARQPAAAPANTSLR